MSTLSSRRCIYQTVPGRSGWPSRDPLREVGFQMLENDDFYANIAGCNLYAFIDNNSIFAVDALGLESSQPPGTVPTFADHYLYPFPPYEPYDANSPCCCSKSEPGKVFAERTDSSPTRNYGLAGWGKSTLHFSVKLTTTGCVKNIIIQWSRCYSRPSPLSNVYISGYQGSGNSVDSVVYTPGLSYYGFIADKWLTFARVNYLACESGFWKPHTEDQATKGYVWNGWNWE